MKPFAAGEHAFLNENQTTTCSRSRAQLRLTSKGSLMLDSTQSSDGVITKPSSKSVAQTIDGLRRLMADRGFTVFNVIDHSGVAERAGVQMPDSKLVMFGKSAVGAWGQRVVDDRAQLGHVAGRTVDEGACDGAVVEFGAAVRGVVAAVPVESPLR